MSEIRRWLDDLDLGRYADVFELNDVDLDALGELSDDDLASLGVSLGHRRRILKAIREGGAPARPAPRRAAEGQRRHATVLFADVAGFTALSERLDPESVHSLMDGCVAILAEGIHRYEGTITQYAGDGTMALFGAPAAQEDHAARAAHAALDLQALARRLRGRGRAAARRELRMRIGLNSGLVVVGHLGDDHRMDYTALGDTVNLAARLEQIAEPGEIYASERTRRQAGDGFEWIDLGRALRCAARARRCPCTVSPRGGGRTRGRGCPSGPASPPWSGAATSRGAHRRLGERGRGPGARRVDRRGGRAGQEPAAPGVHPPPGGGRRAARGGHLLHLRREHSFLPFLRIVRELCGVADADPEPAAKKAIAARLDALGLASEITAPYLHNLLSYHGRRRGLPVPDAGAGPPPDGQRAPRPARRRGARGAPGRGHRGRALDRQGHRGGHRRAGRRAGRPADPAYAGLPAGVPQPVARRAYHDEVHLHPLPESGGSAMVRSILAKPYAANVALPPLTADQTLAVAQRILGEDAISPELEQLIVDRTEGNPLFVEELTQTLLEGGAVGPPRGDLPPLPPGRGAEIPPNLQGVLLARIDRLPEDLRATLRLAATIGRVFSPQVLAAASQDGSAVAAHLERLQELDFVHRVGPGPGGDYSFKHVLTQESVYSTLRRAEPRRLPRGGGARLRGALPDRLEENAEILARHFDEAGERESRRVPGDRPTGRRPAATRWRRRTAASPAPSSCSAGSPATPTPAAPTCGCSATT